MFSAITFTNVNTASVDLLTSGYAVKNLDWSYEYDGSEFPKQSDSGQNPAQSFVRRLIVNMTVQILGASAAAHWTNRHTFAAAFLVADGAQTTYHHGVLSVTPTGGSAMTMNGNVTALDFSLPVEESAARYSTATVTLRGDRGYWLTGSTVVYF